MPLKDIMAGNESLHLSNQANSDSEYVYVILTAVTSGLSIVGGATICILYVSFRDMRTTSRSLLFFLALSDALLALGNLLGVIWYLYSDSKVIHKNHGYCAFQSAMTIYFSCTSFFWTVTMALNLFNAVVMRNASFAATYMKMFHLLAWIPPGIIVVVALSMDVLGTDTSLGQASWCWIDPRTPNVLLWQFATGKVWEILSYITVVALYMAVKVFLKKQELKKKTMVGPGNTKRSRRDVIAEANRKLTFVPLVFIVCRIWGTLRFLLGNFAVEHINEPYVTWINPLQGIGDSAQGFANCVLYCLSTEKIRNRLAKVVCPTRFIPKHTLDEGHDSFSRYSMAKRTQVGVAVEGSHSVTYTDINKFEIDKSSSGVDTNINQSSDEGTTVVQPTSVVENNIDPSEDAIKTSTDRLEIDIDQSTTAQKINVHQSTSFNKKPGCHETFSSIADINHSDIKPTLHFEGSNVKQIITLNDGIAEDDSKGKFVGDMFSVAANGKNNQSAIINECSSMATENVVDESYGCVGDTVG